MNNSIPCAGNANTARVPLGVLSQLVVLVSHCQHCQGILAAPLVLSQGGYAALWLGFAYEVSETSVRSQLALHNQGGVLAWLRTYEVRSQRAGYTQPETSVESVWLPSDSWASHANSVRVNPGSPKPAGG